MNISELKTKLENDYADLQRQELTLRISGGSLADIVVNGHKQANIERAMHLLSKGVMPLDDESA